ncbi:MAG: hypothetical protein E7131_07900 [Rikenellaceae bacterium]|nr:hypothetical protein [Rikenellaceae bacterium]
MKKGLTGISILLASLTTCSTAASAQEPQTEPQKEKSGFFRKAFRDMKESAKLQHQIDKANFEAAKLESKAFFYEQKNQSHPTARTKAEKERMQQELDAANKRVKEAQEKLDAAKGR